MCRCSFSALRCWCSFGLMSFFVSRCSSGLMTTFSRFMTAAIVCLVSSLMTTMTFFGATFGLYEVECGNEQTYKDDNQPETVAKRNDGLVLGAVAVASVAVCIMPVRVVTMGVMAMRIMSVCIVAVRIMAMSFLPVCIVFVCTVIHEL